MKLFTIFSIFLFLNIISIGQSFFLCLNDSSDNYCSFAKSNTCNLCPTGGYKRLQFIGSLDSPANGYCYCCEFKHPELYSQNPRFNCI